MSVPPATVESPPRLPKNYPTLQNLKDEELLARFVKTSEEGAFATLVARYSSLVFGVCKRVLGNAADAEDAFQATFLVLVKKGVGLQQPGRLANWLYGVALRTASHVKSKRAQRARVEREANSMPAKSDTSDITDMNYEQLWNVLDEEINQLPPKYALPLTLCYLEGKTNAEAATQLGWPEGSMSRRLSRAKDLLRARLSKRGMAMSVVLLAAAMFARPASASAPAQLMASTVEAGTLVAQGAKLADVVSPFAADVAEEVALSLTFGLKLIASLTMAAASVVVATSVVIYHVAAPEDASFFLKRSPPSAAVRRATSGDGGSVSISVPVPKDINSRPNGNSRSEEVKNPDSANSAKSGDR